jgi:hypothetical protein
MEAKFLARAVDEPLAIILLGCVPYVGRFFYSGHGGLAWLLLPLCLPYIVVRLSVKIRRSPNAQRVAPTKGTLVALIVYCVAAYPLSRLTEISIRSSVGLQLLPGTVFKQATWPLGKLLPPYHAREELEYPDLYREHHPYR